jgi:hypothetical protein
VGSAGLAHVVTLERQGGKTLALSSPRGTLWVDAGLEASLPILAAIARTPPDSRLLVVPFTTAINFLSGRQGAADGMPSYLPMEFSGGYDDAAVVSRWERHPPDYVLWLHGEMTEFGNHEFGVTYAQQAGRWIMEHYRPVTSAEAQAVLLRWSGGTGAAGPVAP